MSEKILKLFIKKGFLLDREMLDFFNELGDEELANEVADKLKVISHEKIITKNLINHNLDKIINILESTIVNSQIINDEDVQEFIGKLYNAKKELLGTDVARDLEENFL